MNEITRQGRNFNPPSSASNPGASLLSPALATALSTMVTCAEPLEHPGRYRVRPDPGHPQPRKPPQGRQRRWYWQSHVTANDNGRLLIKSRNNVFSQLQRRQTLLPTHCGFGRNVSGSFSNRSIHHGRIKFLFADRTCVNHRQPAFNCLAMTLIAAPPRTKILTISRVTTWGKALTPSLATPWSRQKQQSQPGPQTAYSYPAWPKAEPLSIKPTQRAGGLGQGQLPLGCLVAHILIQLLAFLQIPRVHFNNCSRSFYYCCFRICGNPNNTITT